MLKDASKCLVECTVMQQKAKAFSVSSEVLWFKSVVPLDLIPLREETELVVRVKRCDEKHDISCDYYVTPGWDYQITPGADNFCHILKVHASTNNDKKQNKQYHYSSLFIDQLLAMTSCNNWFIVGIQLSKWEFTFLKRLVYSLKNETKRN